MATRDEIFTIRRLSPEDAIKLKRQWRDKVVKVAKSYMITNDAQRFELLDLVLNKQTTIKEASALAKILIGSPDLRDQVHDSEDGTQALQTGRPLYQEKTAGEERESLAPRGT